MNKNPKNVHCVDIQKTTGKAISSISVRTVHQNTIITSKPRSSKKTDKYAACPFCWLTASNELDRCQTKNLSHQFFSHNGQRLRTKTIDELDLQHLAIKRIM